jgi:hypothetical protein
MIISTFNNTFFRSRITDGWLKGLRFNGTKYYVRSGRLTNVVPDNVRYV